MKASFDVPKDVFEETKRLVRINNLYFIHNPFETWSKYRFHIEGDVLDYNKFSREFNELLHDNHR